MTRPESRLHHPHLMASNIERTIGFWRDCFGADVVGDESIAGSRNVLLTVGGGRLNLYEHPPNERGPVNHLGVQVADLPSTVERLERAGWQPRPIKHDGPLSYSMVEGPDQLLIEVFHFDPVTTAPHLRSYFDLPPVPEHPGPTGAGTGDLSPQALERLARPPVEPLRPPSIDDLEAVRRWREDIHRAWLDGDPSPEDCGHEETSIGGVRCLTAEGASAESDSHNPRPLVLYFHGGGYCLGSPEVAVPITERLAAGCEIISVDYRLAPEHPFPAAVDDGLAVFEAVTRPEDGNRRRLILAGDSAGANIAVSVALANPGAVDALMLFSPHLEFPTGPAGDRSQSPSDPRSDVDDVTAAWLAAAYRGDRPADDPGLSPGRTETEALTGLPPTLIQVGSIDATLGGASRFARRARLAGVDVTLDVWDGLWHTWQYHRGLPEADRALREAAQFATQQCTVGQ